MKKYLTVEEVRYIQKRIIDEFGGIHGVRDLNSLESAIMRPQIGYYKNIIEEAAALMESLAKNHSFLDGNKRVSFFTTDIFLRLNGLAISCTTEEANNLYNKNLEQNTFQFKIINCWLQDNMKNIGSKS